MRKVDLLFAKLFTFSFLLCAFALGVRYVDDYLVRVDSIAFAKNAENTENMASLPPKEETQRVWKEEKLAAKHTEQSAKELEKPTEEATEELIEKSIQKPAEERRVAPPNNASQSEIQETISQEKGVAKEVSYAETETLRQEFFSDALFIGDSRTVGIMEYGNVSDATFFASSGMSVFALNKKPIAVSNQGKISFEETLAGKQYGKIYLMLGINELGYRFESVEQKYREVLEQIKSCQSTATIYLCANMHVTKEQSEKDAIYNNDNINGVNEMIEGLADNERVFFLDVNELFDDDEGNLSTDFSSDSFHVLGRYYKDLVDWIWSASGDASFVTRSVPLSQPAQ